MPKGKINVTLTKTSNAVIDEDIEYKVDADELKEALERHNGDEVAAMEDLISNSDPEVLSYSTTPIEVNEPHEVKAEIDAILIEEMSESAAPR